jgi:hypothetical protein
MTTHSWSATNSFGSVAKTKHAATFSVITEELYGMASVAMATSWAFTRSPERMLSAYGRRTCLPQRRQEQRLR